MQVLVIGMHRSGTSLINRLINLMGLYIGENIDLMAPTIDNPTGFWERKDVVFLNDRILKKLGFSWWKVSNIHNLDLVNLLDIEDKYKIINIINHLEIKQPWVIKDPRMSILLPIWENYLSNPIVVFVYRDPIEVSNSMFKRDGINVSYGLNLWEYYNLIALKYTQFFPRMFINYSTVLESPFETTRNIYNFLKSNQIKNILLPSVSSVNTFVSSKLYRSQKKLLFLANSEAKMITKYQRELISNLQKGNQPMNINERLSTVSKKLVQFETEKNKVFNFMSTQYNFINSDIELNQKMSREIKVSLYFTRHENEKFSEIYKIDKFINFSVKFIRFQVSHVEGIKRFRFDPEIKPVILNLLETKLIFIDHSIKFIKPYNSNHTKMLSPKQYFFNNNDPYFMFDIISEKIALSEIIFKIDYKYP